MARSISPPSHFSLKIQQSFTILIRSFNLNKNLQFSIFLILLNIFLNLFRQTKNNPTDYTSHDQLFPNIQDSEQVLF